VITDQRFLLSVGETACVTWLKFKVGKSGSQEVRKLCAFGLPDFQTF
jgi:hypothetical protein